MRKQNRIEGLDWVYWLTLIFLIGQIIWALNSMLGRFDELRKNFPSVPLSDIIWSVWSAVGGARFLSVFGGATIAIGLSTICIVLLFLRRPSARRWFFAWAGVAVLIWLFGLFQYPSGMTGIDIAGEIGGLVGLMIELALLNNAFLHICGPRYDPSTRTIINVTNP